MKATIYILIVVTMILLSGCKKSILILNGIRQPKIENYESQKEFLKKYDLPVNEIISFKDSVGIYKLSYKSIGIPDAAIFDANGYFLPYANDTVNCNAGVSPFIEFLIAGSETRIDSSFKMDFLFNELVYSDSQKPLDDSDLHGKYDYYVMFFWSVFTGRLNKKKVYEWYQSVEEQKQAGLKIRSYFVNLDCQEFWGYNENQLRKFKY